ncbi:MAG: hypothetical protein KHX87_07855 [Streptococcus parasanguinis]|uniref:Uncharacterized protein n=1 Tax=Streptococcus parasanguinis TaxID=1318 RepID=A0A943HM52_STRPA|nr:hypothetical protein [Streptococcus parasanguinis]
MVVVFSSKYFIFSKEKVPASDSSHSLK